MVEIKVRCDDFAYERCESDCRTCFYLLIVTDINFSTFRTHKALPNS